MITNEIITSQIPLKMLRDGATLFPFQYDGVRFLAVRDFALIADDPGLGKTVQLIVAANIVALPYRQFRILVLAPKSVRLNWEREIRRWADGKITWTVWNYEKVLLQPWKKELGRATFDLVICDESHQLLKTPILKKKQPRDKETGERPPARETRCGVFMKTVVPNAKRIWLATATPASKSGADYFFTLKLLLPEVFQGWKTRRFQQTFCEQIPDRFASGGVKFEGFANTSLLRDLFSRCAIKRFKERVLPELPPKIYTDYEVEIDPEICAMHLELDTAFVIDCIEKDKPLPGHIAHVMQATALAKLEFALEIINNMPETESIVTFAWHTVVVEELVKKLGTNVGSITGKITNEKTRQQTVDRFQQKELTRLVNNMQAGGVGITLTAARTALYVEFAHSVIHMKQSENRVHRIGTSGQVNIIRLIGRNTIDKQIFEALDNRMKMIGEVGI